jgi:hypothetical protein
MHDQILEAHGTDDCNTRGYVNKLIGLRERGIGDYNKPRQNMAPTLIFFSGSSEVP